MSFHQAVSRVAMRIAVCTLLLPGPLVLEAQAARTVPPPEVRQIVTFHFQPGRTADAVSIYARQLKPIYTAVTPLRRFRAYREAESPEPLDLIVVSSYDGMAGMDAANDALRRTDAGSPSAFTLYGTLAAMTQSHHDQFVEMMPVLGDSLDAKEANAPTLTVFEYIRVAPGAHTAFETLHLTDIRLFEKVQALYLWSETGRMLVSDGWDYVRIFGLRSLADWHRYQDAVRGAAFSQALYTLTAARKTIIVRHDPTLSVR